MVGGGAAKICTNKSQLKILFVNLFWHNNIIIFIIIKIIDCLFGYTFAEERT